MHGLVVDVGRNGRDVVGPRRPVGLLLVRDVVLRGLAGFDCRGVVTSHTLVLVMTPAC